LNAAIAAFEELKQGPPPKRRGNRFQPLPNAKELRTGLAVMYHHRGEVQQALGNADAAKGDFEKASAYGYNPDQGVF
jgi:thioredoxin-like negative regulator of GroEL